MAQGVETWSPPKEFSGGLKVTGGGLEVEGGIGIDAEITLAAAGGGAQTASVQFNDPQGAALTVPSSVPWYLADDSAGLDPTTSAPDGGVAAGTDGALIEWLANLSGLAVSEADGDLDIVVTGSAGTFFLVLVMPGGKLVISSAIIPTP